MKRRGKRSLSGVLGYVPEGTDRTGRKGLDTLLAWSAYRNPTLFVSTLAQATTTLARDMAVSDSHVAGWLRRAQRHVLGAQGLMPRSLLMRTDGTPDREGREDLERLWTRWTRTADDRRRRTWRQVQGDLLTAYLRDGETFVRLFVRGARLRVRTLDCFDVPYLWSQTPGTAISGLEMDDRGRPLAWWIDTTPDNARTTMAAGVDSAANLRRVPSQYVIHLADTCGYPTALRGLSRLVPAQMRLSWLRRYELAVLRQAARAAKAGGFIQETDDGLAADPQTSSSDDDTGLDVEYLEDLEEDVEGTYIRLRSGLEFNAQSPNTPPSGQLPEFCQVQLAGAASALGLSYAGLSGDFARSNYSSSRAALVDEAEEWGAIQALIGEVVLSRLWRLVIDMAALRGELPSTDPDWIERAYEVEWCGPTMRSIDPAKEARARIERVKSGLQSLSGAILEEGGDPDRVFEQRARDAERLEELGLPPIAGGEPEPEGEDDAGDDGDESPQPPRD